MTTEPSAAVEVRSAFEAHSRELWGLLYRMTGCAADADDLLQDTFRRALEHPPRRLDQPLKPWLARVALNLARDHLRQRKRRAYIGPWLPSPIETGDDVSPPSHEPSPEYRYDLVESVSFAFLLALEALSPAQRAVLLLRDVFDYSVKETAEALDLSQANVKQLHLRARRKLRDYHAERTAPTPELQAATVQVLTALVQHISAHDVPAIEALLAEGVRVLNDGAGEVRAATRPVTRPDRVARFLCGIAKKGGGGVSGVQMRNFNGAPAIMLEYAHGHGRVAGRAVFAIELDQHGRIRTVYTVLARRKLSGVEWERATAQR